MSTRYASSVNVRWTGIYCTLNKQVNKSFCWVVLIDFETIKKTTVNCRVGSVGRAFTIHARGRGSNPGCDRSSYRELLSVPLQNACQYVLMSWVLGFDVKNGWPVSHEIEQCANKLSLLSCNDLDCTWICTLISNMIASRLFFISKQYGFQ